MREIIRPGNTGIKIKYNNTCPFADANIHMSRRMYFQIIIPLLVHMYYVHVVERKILRQYYQTL